MGRGTNTSSGQGRSSESPEDEEGVRIDLEGMKKGFYNVTIKKVRKIWFWIAILAFFVGLFVGSQYYEVQCNKMIMKERACKYGDLVYGADLDENSSPDILNFSGMKVDCGSPG